MANLIELTFQAIDIGRLLAVIASPLAGAEVLFVGTTRQTTLESSSPALPAGDIKVHSEQPVPGKVTSYLIYEAYEEMALKQLNHLAEQARQQWTLQGVAIVHRLGKVMPLEASIAIAVSSPHRAEAFAAGRWLIDTIKRDVPIWKQENYQNQTAEWVHPTLNPSDGNCSPSEPVGEREVDFKSAAQSNQAKP